MTTKNKTPETAHHRNLAVVGYYDLRPVDWVSGKRMPLEGGEGHICDRCGALHAIVWCLKDVNSQEIFKVGSGCAKKSWGFDPSEDAKGRALVKEVARDVDRQLFERRVGEAEQVAGVIINSFRGVNPPPSIFEEVSSSSDTIKGKVWVGDSYAYWQTFNTKENAYKVALSGWYDNRIKEMIEPKLKNVLITDPDSKPKRSVAMADEIHRLVRRIIRY
jgi:hypothetical protein